MGEETKNLWIFIEKDLMAQLSKNADRTTLHGVFKWYYWDATENVPATTLRVIFGRDNLNYVQVVEIKAEDIAFTVRTPEPEDVVFIRMSR